ncbi:hypothetical protein N1851_024499 [Merluccius polli]|uniref:Uncharacterized protein n=1 Tax=Merluccius polli TaxID=89951 RepID=A0AA47MF28_MERPO|nr:hypothetical protein N1851_024499 [Merluccius polli]
MERMRRPIVHVQLMPEEHECVVREGSGSGGSAAGLGLSSSLEQTAETEQMFPKMKVPKFVTLQPGFGKNLKSKVVEVRFPEIPKKSRKAALHQRHLRHMYDATLTNMAVSKRHDVCLPDAPLKKRQKAAGLPVSQAYTFSHLYLRPAATTINSALSERKAKVRRSKTRDPLSLEDVCQQTDVQVSKQYVWLYVINTL